MRFGAFIFRLTPKLGDLTYTKTCTSPNIISPQVKSFFKFTFNSICINNGN